MNKTKRHQKDVKRIQKSVRRFYKRGEKVKIYHGSTNSMRRQSFIRGHYVDVSKLNWVLKIDRTNLVAVTEPNVNMEHLVEETLKYNLIPKVVMEFKNITVGGGIQGGAGESSSFKYGCFNNICTEYEVVTGNGEVIKANEHTHRDLFYGTTCSYGTLGIITKATISLMPAKPYVKLTYVPVKNFAAAHKVLEKERANNWDFIDGIMFSQNSGIVMLGKLSEYEELPLVTFSKKDDDWFYLHAQKKANNPRPATELLELREYLFRYDRGAFWMGKYFFEYLYLPSTKLTRKMFAKALDTTTMYKLLQETNMSQKLFVQDLCMPSDKVEKMFDFMSSNVKIFPIWLCPGYKTTHEKLSVTSLKNGPIINLGVYGGYKKPFDEFVATNRAVEKEVKRLGGRKVLYAHAYYSAAEFWDIYDKDWYDRIRAKYACDVVFPDVYSKVKVSEHYRTTLFRGIWRVLTSKAKL